MSIRFGCPSCGKKYAVNEQMMGRTVKCSACAKSFNIPKDLSASESSSSKLKPARPMRQATSLPQSAPDCARARVDLASGRSTDTNLQTFFAAMGSNGLMSSLCLFESIG